MKYIFEQLWQENHVKYMFEQLWQDNYVKYIFEELRQETHVKYMFEQVVVAGLPCLCGSASNSSSMSVDGQLSQLNNSPLSFQCIFGGNVPGFQYTSSGSLANGSIGISSAATCVSLSDERMASGASKDLLVLQCMAPPGVPGQLACFNRAWSY